MNIFWVSPYMVCVGVPAFTYAHPNVKLREILRFFRAPFSALQLFIEPRGIFIHTRQPQHPSSLKCGKKISFENQRGIHTSE